jgi:hypothetical protein
MIKSMPLTFDSSRVNKNLFTTQDYSAMDKNVSSQNLMVSDRFAEFFIKGVRSFRKLQKQFSRFQNISEYFRVFQTGFKQVSGSFRRFQKLLKQFQKMFRTVLESFLKHCHANRLYVPKPAQIQTPLTIPWSQASSKISFGGMATCEGACESLRSLHHQAIRHRSKQRPTHITVFAT